MVERIISEEQAEKARERSRRWYQDNKEKVSETKKEYYKVNKDSINARNNLYNQVNREDRSRYQREYYEANRELILAKKKTYCKENPDKRRVWEFKRRAVKKDAKIESCVDWEFIIRRDNGICYLCGNAIVNNLHYDHKVPLSRGGSHSTDNIFMTHGKCNFKKGSKLLEELHGVG